VKKFLQKIKSLANYLFNLLVLGVIVAILITPLFAPYLVEFHPLLVTPYYGLIWWTAGVGYLIRKHLDHRLNEYKGPRFNKKDA
tara:strand:- start:1703 stop:1954 length:252 start_codon:yes stop_codon:yes gene_type:complete